jgi:uncharacterized membrane protein YgdD (TMEM256/DUF423 family)
MEGKAAMTYVTRMCLRMMVPALALTGAGAGLTGLGQRMLEEGIASGTPVSGLAMYLGYATFVGGLLLTTLQLVRLLRWKAGVGASCFVCSCLLLAERESRSGIYRRCAGCGKTHGCSGLIRAAR